MKRFFLFSLLCLFCLVGNFAQQVTVKSVTTQSELKKLNTADINNVVLVLGGLTVNDGAGGIWYFNKTSTATPDDILVIQSNQTATGRWLRVTVGGGSSQTAIGLVGDGVTLNDSVFNLILSAIPWGSTLRIEAPGTYLVNSISITKKLSFDIGDGVVFKHKAAADDSMFDFLVAPVSIRGGIFDGNKDNQPALSQNWWPLVRVVNQSTNFVIVDFERIVFTNFVFGGIWLNQFNGQATVSHCSFLNGKRHGGTLGLQSQGINLGLTTVDNSRPNLIVENCYFLQDEPETDLHNNPGGIIVNGYGAGNIHPLVTVKNCYFKRIGQTYADNHIGNIDLYEDVLDADISGNHIDDAYYVGFKMSNCGKITVHDNVINGNTINAIWYDPHQRTDTNDIHEIALISHNIVTNSSYGIVIAGNIGLGRSVIVDHNWVEGCNIGMDIGATGGLVGFSGPINFIGNVVTNVANIAVQLQNVRGEYKFVGNTFSGLHGLLSTVGNTNATFILDGNYMNSTNSGGYGCVIFGAAEVLSLSGVYDNTAGGTAVYFSENSDGADLQKLTWNEANIVKATKNFDFTKIYRFEGSVRYPGTPEALGVSAPPGTRWYNENSGGDFWIKESSTNSTGWARVGPTSFIPAADSSVAFEFLKHDAATRLLRIDSVNDAIIAGPADTYFNYRFNLEEDTAALANLLGLKNDTAGGAVNLALIAGTAQGGVRAWSPAFASGFLQNKVGLRLESTASAIALAADGSGQTIDMYANEPTLKFQVDSLGVYVNRRIKINPATGDLASPADGEIWYNSSTGKFRKRENGTTSNMDTSGAGTTITVEEEDGTPSVAVDKIKFPNGTLTDNGDGSASVTTSGGGSGDDITINGTSLINPDFQDTATIFWILDTAPVPDTIKAYATNIANAQIAAGANIAASKLDPSVILDTEIDTSAEIAAIVIDETGTGSLVFGTSPSLSSPILSGTFTLGGSPSLPANGISTATTGIIFEGATADANETLLTVTDPTADRTITLPNASGNVILDTSIDTSAEIAAIVGDETGSGALVFGTSPTLGTPTLNTPTVNDPVLVGTATLAGNPSLSANGIGIGTTGLIFEGATANNFEGLLTASDPTADRTWTLPDSSGNIILDTSIDTSAELATILTDETGSGSLVFGTSPTLTTPTISGAITFPSNVRQIFSPGATVPGINVGSRAGDPSSLSNGDLWYDTTANTLKAQIGGSTVSLAGGSGSGDVTAASAFGTDNRVIRSDGTGKGVQSSSVSIDDSGNMVVPGTISGGTGSGVAASDYADADNSNFFTFTAPTDIVTNINVILADRPQSGGIAIYTQSAVTNLTMSFVNTLSGLETAFGSINIIQATEIDTSAEIAAIVGDETGSGSLVFGTSPTIGSATLNDPLLFGTSTLAGNPALAANGITIGTTGIIFEGATANNLETLLTVADPTSDRTLTLPDATGTLIVDTAIDTSSELAAILTDETGSGSLVFGTSPTLTTPTVSGAISFPDNVRQTFNPGTTTPGLNVGANAGDPSTPSNGDLWYDSNTDTLRARINGVNTTLSGLGTVVNDAAFSSAWIGETGNAPSRNTLYNYLHIADTDDDGKINVLDMGAGIVKTDASGVVSVASPGTDYTSPSSTENFTNKSFDAAGTGNTLKQTKYLKLSFPRLVDGAGCGYSNTNNASGAYFMVPLFSASAATNANYCRFGFRVPKDLDTSVNMTASLTINLSADDTDGHIYHVGVASVANSSAANATAGNWNALTITGDASGANGDQESVENVTLTGWAAALTPGQWCVVELRRDGAGDASIQASYLQELELSYGSTQ